MWHRCWRKMRIISSFLNFTHECCDEPSNCKHFGGVQFEFVTVQMTSWLVVSDVGLPSSDASMSYLKLGLVSSMAYALSFVPPSVKIGYCKVCTFSVAGFKWLMERIICLLWCSNVPTRVHGLKLDEDNFRVLVTTECTWNIVDSGVLRLQFYKRKASCPRVLNSLFNLKHSNEQ